MGLLDDFNGNKAASSESASPPSTPFNFSNLRKYGEAWLLIVGQKQKELGLQKMQELDKAGFIDSTLALSMFCMNKAARKELIRKAALAGDPEGLWAFSETLPHSFVPDPNNAQDNRWETVCVYAAEEGCSDAMNEMGNVFHRRGHFSESMYWYAMANAYEHPQGQAGMTGIASEWKQSGCPKEFHEGSPNFNRARHTCAISYLELYAGYELSTSLDDIVNLALDGIPIAGYLAGDIFEAAGNDAMAYKFYNALAFEDDAHALKCCADMLYAGKGTQRDQKKAYNMYMKAAFGGERAAMFIMGELTEAIDKYIAAYWYGASHTRGFEYSLPRLIQLAQ